MSNVTALLMCLTGPNQVFTLKNVTKIPRASPNKKRSLSPPAPVSHQPCFCVVLCRFLFIIIRCRNHRERARIIFDAYFCILSIFHIEDFNSFVRFSLDSKSISAFERRKNTFSFPITQSVTPVTFTSDSFLLGEQENLRTMSANKVILSVGTPRYSGAQPGDCAILSKRSNILAKS